ncbi:ABC transporter ATP-binding protein [Bradyrhizobium sp. 14AA]
MMDALLKLENVDAGYGAVQVLSGVSFTVRRGDRLTVLGRNGAGKSTLMKAVVGLATQTGGSILFAGENISSESPDERAMRGIGFVPQTRNIFRSLSVEENLLTGLKGRSRACLEESYQMFPRLAERRRSWGKDLSGGEQQMLAIARTLLGKPVLLLLDEPLEGLAPLICEQLMETFAALAATSDMAIVLVEQKVESALNFASRAIVLEHGSIVLSDVSEALIDNQDVLDRYLAVA